MDKARHTKQKAYNWPAEPHKFQPDCKTWCQLTITDAADVGLGEALSQGFDGDEWPSLHIGRMLNLAE
ncbi:hypothetical protein SRHO_G00236530 [Serrasalmus rhombeus]